MCKRVTCPNDGKPTWWGCGAHIETALAGVATADRCDCPHVPVEGNPRMFEVKKTEDQATA
ncbi:uncharacterized protein EHS24_001406 [Apiotrichum porosum]|uniref:Uncharacterized protein n=1 Tax=Apiotrichum porosum TaxID=105984 RepID=A0A427XKS4_9TREE|nr:uncharacterized protein EHS24_001406 [Apiotrichum porosum]RSH79364.1 hypothetical protein EHS24_001406 [Apiotrichum porosum]